MDDYHAIQLTGSKCQGKNCACASAAMAIYFGTGGKVRLTADQVRAQSGESCVPGVHSASGGLFIEDVIRVAGQHNVFLDYGQPIPYTRWPSTQMRIMLDGNFGAVVLGDYDQIPSPYRSPGSSFMGDHSAFAHDFRTDLAPYPGGPRDPGPTFCWHDPLRSSSIRLPESILVRYWQKPTSAIRGYAGFVMIPLPPAPETDVEADKMPGLSFRFANRIPGTVTVSKSGATLIRVDTQQRVKVPMGQVRDVAALVTLTEASPNPAGGSTTPKGSKGYLVGNLHGVSPDNSIAAVLLDFMGTFKAGG